VKSAYTGSFGPLCKAMCKDPHAIYRRMQDSEGRGFDHAVPGRAKLHAWGVQFHVFWACHALHAQNCRGVIGACLIKNVHRFKCALGAPVHRIFFGAIPCHLGYFFRARCLTAPPSVHKQGAQRYEEWEPCFRRAPTNKVLDAMMRGRHLCGTAQQRPPAVISHG